MRLFADDSSLFTCVNGITETHDKLVNDLETRCGLINGNWFLTTDITEQAIDVMFSCKKKKPDHLELSFNDIPISRQPVTKHLMAILRYLIG